MNIKDAKTALDKVINKARVHLYKPIQIAEILYKARTVSDFDILALESYRCSSRGWRDEICQKLLGRTCTSSARYQDDVFNENATPPRVLALLDVENKAKKGIVEAYIYSKFSSKYTQMTDALNYTNASNKETFDLKTFINLFWEEPGLRRSIDKIYEIVVYAIFTVLVSEINVKITVNYNPKEIELLKEFSDFAQRVICIDPSKPEFTSPAKIYRVGVTNAADRGLDMWGNFGPAVQIKHLQLTEDLAEGIVDTVSSDRIVIVCKSTEQQIIKSLLNQLGWRSRIQSIITEDDLCEWYNKALKGQFKARLGDKVLTVLRNEIVAEFPSADTAEVSEVLTERQYNQLDETMRKDPLWGSDDR